MSEHRRLTPAEVLERLPQREPFRFVDAIYEIDDERVVAGYTWDPQADFYRGHFPGNPVTPGVLLIESMAQAGVVAHGLFLLSGSAEAADAGKLVTVFTDANVEFTGLVRPGDRVRIEAKKVFFRRRKLRSEALMRIEGGDVVCCGVLSGMGVPA